jgi:Uncharacterized protein conserved in bacteria (DUF2188).
MTQRKKYHVVKSDDQWKVKAEGAKRATRTFDTKAEAVAEGRERGHAAELSQLIIHKANGRIQTEHTYGKDPRDIEG